MQSGHPLSSVRLAHSLPLERTYHGADLLAVRPTSSTGIQHAVMSQPDGLPTMLVDLDTSSCMGGDRHRHVIERARPGSAIHVCLQFNQWFLQYSALL